MPAAAASSAPRLPIPLLRMNAPAEIRGAISERVMGRPMGYLAGCRDGVPASGAPAGVDSSCAHRPLGQSPRTASGPDLPGGEDGAGSEVLGGQRPRRERALKLAAD